MKNSLTQELVYTIIPEPDHRRLLQYDIFRREVEAVIADNKSLHILTDVEINMILVEIIAKNIINSYASPLVSSLRTSEADDICERLKRLISNHVC